MSLLMTHMSSAHIVSIVVRRAALRPARRFSPPARPTRSRPVSPSHATGFPIMMPPGWAYPAIGTGLAGAIGCATATGCAAYMGCATAVG